MNHLDVEKIGGKWRIIFRYSRVEITECDIIALGYSGEPQCKTKQSAIALAEKLDLLITNTGTGKKNRK